MFADSFVQSILQRQTLQVEWDDSEVMWWAQLLVGLVGVEFNAPLDTYRSFRRRSSQPITSLILTNKTVQENTDKQTQYKSEKVNNLKYSKTKLPWFSC